MEESKVTSTLNSLANARKNYAGFQSKHKAKDADVRGMSADLGFTTHFKDRCRKN